MKNIAVYFDEPALEDYPFNITYYRNAYHELAETVTEKGAQFSIVRSPKSYVGGRRFAKHWVYDEGGFSLQDDSIRVDMLLKKGRLDVDDTLTLLNPEELESICHDKWKTSRTFSHLMPSTCKVDSKKELTAALKNIRSEMVVAKPLASYGGRGVIVGSKKHVQQSVKTFPYLIQECVDTSNGIPGIVEGRHDFRIVGINGRPILSYVRTPNPGKLSVDVEPGGGEFNVPLKNIPPDALELFTKADAVLASRFPRRVISVDMGRNSDGSWQIFELNDKPGMPLRKDGPNHMRFQEILSDILVK